MEGIIKVYKNSGLKKIFRLTCIGLENKTRIKSSGFRLKLSEKITSLNFTIYLFVALFLKIMSKLVDSVYFILMATFPHTYFSRKNMGRT
jgi:hypothetical protein